MASGISARTGRVFNTYHRLTRTGTYSFIAALPLFILYEVMINLANAGRVAQVRVGAEVWIKQMIPLPGRLGVYALLGIMALVGLIIVFAERKKHISIKPKYFGWMILESAVYAVIVAILVSNVVSALFTMAAGSMARQGLPAQLALSIGAGLYEELFFRVLLVGGLYAILSRILAKRNTAYLASALIGALAFSAVHYIGSLGDPFTLQSFTFRFLFGLALNGLYLVRGFGIAAWTHSLYDVFIVTHLLG